MEFENGCTKVAFSLLLTNSSLKFHGRSEIKLGSKTGSGELSDLLPGGVKQMLTILGPPAPALGNLIQELKPRLHPTESAYFGLDLFCQNLVNWPYLVSVHFLTEGC